MLFPLPEMDGVEATVIIRKTYSGKERPKIVALTASAMKADQEKCLNAGMEDFVSKPINTKKLISTLKKCA